MKDPVIYDYFAGQLQSKRRWAHCYRAGLLTLGADTTQRIESMNSKIQARSCTAATSVGRLLSVLDVIDICNDVRSAQVTITSNVIPIMFSEVRNAIH